MKFEIRQRDRRAPEMRALARAVDPCGVNDRDDDGVPHQRTLGLIDGVDRRTGLEGCDLAWLEARRETLARVARAGLDLRLVRHELVVHDDRDRRRVTVLEDREVFGKVLLRP